MAFETGSSDLAMKSPILPPKLEKKGSKQRPTFNNPTQLVTIFVKDGDNETKFLLHRIFACQYSPIFRVAFNSNSLEGQTQTYKLSDTDADTVQFLIEWLYSQQLSMTQLVDIISNRHETAALLKLWVLVDRLLMLALQISL
ncbi:hypothetical protein BDZ45DRAFT_754150 [Acephala macrosclerotiorum]|nr:hypothetical protein BDZ45DRAFT_754150 [Acephala macrosclerotiorum]